MLKTVCTVLALVIVTASVGEWAMARGGGGGRGGGGFHGGGMSGGFQHGGYGPDRGERGLDGFVGWGGWGDDWGDDDYPPYPPPPGGQPHGYVNRTPSYSTPAASPKMYYPASQAPRSTP